eukprot:2985234-Rhodomonas_salina.2
MQSCRPMSGTNVAFSLLSYAAGIRCPVLTRDILLPGTPSNPCVSLYLRDPDVMTASSYLSVWLDNVMASGLRQSVNSSTETVRRALYQFAFSPERIQSNGKQVLEWLKRECRQEYHRGRAVVSSQYGNVVLGWVFEGVAPARTYWLYRERGDDLLQLYQLTSAHSTHEQHSHVPPRFALPVGVIGVLVLRSDMCLVRCRRIRYGLRWTRAGVS